MSLRHSKYLRERFIAIGVSKNLACGLSTQVSQWVSQSGPEWTVRRLKLLKTGLMKRIAGETYNLPYVATRKDAQGAVPKGAFGLLWNTVLVSDVASISRALNCMMVYSNFYAENVTPSQWEKFHNSMTRPPADAETVKGVVDSLCIPKWMRVDGATELERVEQFVVRKGYAPKYVSDAIEQFVESDTGMALWEEFPQYKHAFSTIASPIESRIGWDDMFNYHPKLDSRVTKDPVGTLGLTQEPGFKLRVFANPNICHQLAMSRLKRQLFSLLRGVNWDCTYDQSRGTDWVQGQLNQGRKIWSVDLSDATNNFPLEIQLEILRKIGVLEEDVQLFQRLARAPWKNPHGASRQMLRWTVGQPLGLGPSFAAFALSHGLLVHSLARNFRVTDSFRVLGDDIVISDERVASAYMDVMQRLGIPVSMDKTISSNGFAEFAGKVVTTDGVISVLKWREPSDRSFLDVVRLLGPRSFALLKERQRRVANIISVLPEPRGFGWNPDGIPLQARLQVLDAFEKTTLEVERTYYPLERQWLKIRCRLEQPYFSLQFVNWPHGSYMDNPTGRASGKVGSELPPGSSGWYRLLNTSRITGAPLKLPEWVLTPTLTKELARDGYVTLTASTDPRGLTTLEGLEKRIAKLQIVLEQEGLTPFFAKGRTPGNTRVRSPMLVH